MARDYTEKVAKQAVALLGAEEPVRRAVVVNPIGGVMDTFGTGEIDVRRVSRQVQAADAAARVEGGVAASIPRKNAFLAVTDRRFVIFDLTWMGRLKSVVGAFTPEEIAELRVERRDRTTQELYITFDDGSTCGYAVIQKQDGEGLAAAFDSLR